MTNGPDSSGIGPPPPYRRSEPIRLSLRSKPRPVPQDKLEVQPPQWTPSTVKQADVWNTATTHRRSQRRTNGDTSGTRQGTMDRTHQHRQSHRRHKRPALVDGATLYADRFVNLTTNELRIKTYYFPLLMSRTVPLSQIDAMYYATPGSSDVLHTRSWGCSLTATWWACDCAREWRTPTATTTNVALSVRNEQCLKGFSVRNFQGFFNALRRAMPHDIPVINGMP